jgi:hypothetical protein
MANERATPEYAKPPEEVDMARGERGIRMASLIVFVVLTATVVAGRLLLPGVLSFPTRIDERLAFAAQSAVFVVVWVLVGVFLVSTGRRFSPADSGGSAARPPSEGLAIKVAFLQNTLEQAVLAIAAYLALATLLAADWLFVIPMAVVFFGVGRVLFLRGYEHGAAGRALGMTLTLLPTTFGYLTAVVLVVAQWL